MCGNPQNAVDEKQECEQQHDVAEQAKFFSESGKDKVGGALGDKFKVRLRATHKAFAPHAARANGNHALQDVKAFAQRVAHGVEQGANALLLVFAQNRPAHAFGAQARLKCNEQPDCHHAQHQRGQDQLPAQACKVDDRCASH